MAGSILGTSVQRVEDPALLRGDGTFIDNLAIDGALHLAFVRSPIAHGHITSIDTAAAAAMPGVVAVYTADDIGVPDVGGFAMLNPAFKRPALAVGKVRFVGDPVVAVVAATKGEAADAADAVVVEYEPLASVTDMEAALAPDAPVLWEEVGSNLGAGLRSPDDLDSLAGADVVVRGRFVNQRIAVMPMEGNAIAAIPGDDGAGHTFTVYVSTQMPHGFAAAANRLFGFADGELRVIAPHVGGGFGGKVGVVPEHAVAIAAARSLQRPVKWVETRSENLLSLPHGRGQVQYVEMGFTRDGHIVGTRCRMFGDAGAYGGFGGGLAMGPTYMMSQGTYRIPKIAYDVVVAVTNTTAVGAFRGAGRPEAAAYLERIMDMAADELAIDPVEIRRRNFLQPDQFPVATVTGAKYDVGAYERALDAVLAASDYDALRAEQAARRASGDRVQLGIGVAAYVEVTAGGMRSDYGSVEIHDDGSATVLSGTSAHGQGHLTSYAMIVAELLGIPMDKITVIQSDTAIVPRGSGTGGSRSLQIGGSAVKAAADGVLNQAKELAATMFEADPADITVIDGKLGVAGVPAKAISWGDIARSAREAAERGERDELLRHQVDFTQDDATFPFGAHVAVVEVDLDTGHIELKRHIAVDDCGTIVNPMLVAGQQHGGIAQGVAQVLWEQFVYDDDGNPLTSTLADYGMPSAAEFPSFETSNTETPTFLNPLGAKGIGESGTIGATPAVQNAIVDAVSHLGIRHIDMPCTPERVWRAVRAAEAGTPPAAWSEPPDVFSKLPVRGQVAAPAAAEVDV